MASSNPNLMFAAAVAALLSLSACGGEEEASIAANDTTVVTSDDDAAADDDADHDDEDGDHDEDEEHKDEDGDHKDDEDEHDDHDDEGAEGGLGAHEHGAAELSLAWSEGDMVIDLVSPTFNIFGFEYEPSSDEDLAIVDEQTEALTAPNVLAINAEAGCTTDDVTTETEFEGSHAEITVSWLLTCENPDEITQLDATALFESFPNLEDVDTQWASDSGQSAAELSPTASVVDLG